MAILASEERIDEALALAYGFGALNEQRIRDGEVRNDKNLDAEIEFYLNYIRDELKRA